MSKLYTLAETADLFARLEGRDADGRQLLLRQLRHLDSLRLIKSHSVPRDARGTAQFEAMEVYVARVLLACMQIGLDKNDLPWVRSALVAGRQTIDSDVSLRAVVSQISTDGEWMLQIAQSRPIGVAEAEAVGVAPGRCAIATLVFRRADGSVNAFDDAEAPTVFDDYRLADKWPVEIVSFIKISTVLRPYVEALGA